MTLSGEQSAILNTVKSASGSAAIFTISGKAGTGKSVLTRAIKETGQWLTLAPTGLAGKNVGGVTIHSFLGVQGGQPIHKTIKQLNRNNRMALEAADGVIIDEKSMVRADMIDAIDRIFRTTLRNKEPFGGKTIVLVGDPFQIPPVVSMNKDEDVMLFGADGTYPSPWFFDSRVFSEFSSIVKSYELTHVFRQSGDVAFKDALNALQVGLDDGLPLFNTRVQKAKKGDVCIAFKNQMADSINLRAMEAIDAPTRTFKAMWSKVQPFSYPSPQDLQLKVGARVMITANHREGDYVNGDQGVVVNMTDSTVTVRLGNDDEVDISAYAWEECEYDLDRNGEIISNPIGFFRQIPLRLAYAITAHKSQGQTYQNGHVLMDCKPWDHGMLYVCMSRFTSLEGMSVRRPIERSDIVIDPRVLEWHEKLQRMEAVN